MNSAKYVADLIKQLKDQGCVLSEVAWRAALACVGWAYVFGARGEPCTPANRRKYYASKGAEHPTIRTACKNFDGTGTCSGCKWFPSGNQTRFFDCRGFTYWILLEVFGWKLMGAGATSQWSNGSNWKDRGTIDTMPKDTLVCLFVEKGKTMSHTGFGYNNETVECSSGVQHFTTRNKKWTHWGIPACVEGVMSVPTQDTGTSLPTIRRGSKGDAVKKAQTILYNLGYNLGPCGIDGDFGKATEAAVKEFQRDHGITQDGVIGKNTWAELTSATKPVVTDKLYTVSIHHLDKTQAEAIQNNYPGSTISEE